MEAIAQLGEAGLKYCVSDAGYPMEFASSGNLVSEDGFVHPKRNIDSFVLILVVKGTLYVTQGEESYAVRPNEFLVLLPHTLHYSHRPSEGYLSYYWTHYYVRDPHYKIYTREQLMRQQPLRDEKHGMPMANPGKEYMVPVYGHLSMEKRAHLLFVQLLDISKRENYSSTWRCHYALSLLLLEVTIESYQAGHFLDANIPIQVFDVMEWIRKHYYNTDLSVAAVAEHFNYHPTYLTNLFKKHTGYTILAYINRTRIAVSKNLLSNRDLIIYQVADMCGFKDDKYFMKLFKKYEGITPMQYRNAFHQKKLNNT